MATSCQFISIGWINGLKEIGQLWLDEVSVGGRRGLLSVFLAQQSSMCAVFQTVGRQVGTREILGCSPGKQPCGSKRSRSYFSDLGPVCGIFGYSVVVFDR